MKFGEEKFNAVSRHVTEAWKDVPDIIEWCDNIRYGGKDGARD